MAHKLIHLHNAPTLLNDIQARAYQAGRFSGAKLMPEQGPDHVAQVDALAPGGFYIARLANSWREPENTWLSYYDLGRAWAGQILALLEVGVKWYQLDNEPNLSRAWPAHKAFDWQWLIDRAIQQCWAIITEHWRHQGHSDRVIQWKQQQIKLCIGPMAYNPTTWGSVDNQWIPAMKALASKGRVQGMCINSYWQYAKHVLEGGYGASADVFHRHIPHLPVIVTEWGCSLIDKWPHEQRRNPTQAMLNEIEAEMLKSYPEWLRWANAQSWIIAHCLFILPGSSGWRGFEPSTRVLSVI